MAKGNWNHQKVEALVEAIKNKDVEAIDQLVIIEGKGAMPDKAYGRSIKLGPSSVLAAVIETEDVELFEHLLEFGMPVKSLDGDGGFIRGAEEEVIFGSKYASEKSRSPEMLAKLANNGFDFSSIDHYEIYSLRKFVVENSENLEILETLEKAGLKYWTSSYYGDLEYCSDEDYINSGWEYHESIPWEVFLCEERFDLLDHFVNLGYKPVRPLRLQVGTKEYDRNEKTAVKSTAVIDYLCKHQLPTFGIIVMDKLTDSDADILEYSIEKGVKLYNPEALFASLNFDLIKLALESKICEMKSEYAGPAKAAARDDLLKLYENYGVSADDITAELVDELTQILQGAEYRAGWKDEKALQAANNPKKLKVVKALEENATADWRQIASLLARVYFASYDNSNGNDDGKKSRRGNSLQKLAGNSSWQEIIESCLDKFDGGLDLKLVLPMTKITKEGFWGDDKGFGITYWVDSDADIFKKLSARGVEFLCKLNRQGWSGSWDSDNVENNEDALPGDAFIWLSPEVSALLFEQNDWDMDDLDFSPSWNAPRYNDLAHLLIGSGNRAAYRWFLERESEYEKIKKPAVKDVVNSPLLRTYLEDKKDGSVRSKDNVDFIMQTIKGSFKEDTILYVQKASLDASAIERLKTRLSTVKGDDRKAIAKQAIALLDSRVNQPAPKKKEAANKMTVPQTVTLVADALDEGDTSKLGLLEPIANKVPMADCVELLERAAANCDKASIDKLYELFTPFECVSSALLIALFSGNEASSKALIFHGANLDGKLKAVDEKRTPSAKKAAREKRYAHGLIGKTYSAGGQVAYNLEEALTKYNGAVYSRTRKKGSWKVQVNDPSNEKAADTLIAISSEKGFKKSIAVKLLWNLISFDGRRTTDACFDAVNSRKIFEAGILDESDIAKLPWPDAVSSASASWGGCSVEALKVVRDFAPKENFAKCWRPSFAKPNSWSGEYGNLAELLLFIDVLDSDNCNNQPEVLKALTITGNLEALEKLAKKPGWFTRQRIKKLIDASTETGQTEITAWLLEISEAEKAGKLPQSSPEASPIPVGDTKMSLSAAREVFALKNIGSDRVSIRAYKGDAVNVEIPAMIGKRRVVSVMDEAFYPWGDYCDNSESILKIETINLPLGMEAVGERAFADAEGLKSVKVSATVVKIGDEAFSSCVHLEKVSIDNTNVEIGTGAFQGCISLGKVTIAGKEDFIYTADGSRMLYCPRDVEVLDVKEGVVAIDNALYCCARLKRINLPASFAEEESFSVGYFGSCSSLEYVGVDSSNEEFESFDGALYDKENGRLLFVPRNREELTLSKDMRDCSTWAFGKQSPKRILIEEGAAFWCDGKSLITNDGSMFKYIAIDSDYTTPQGVNIIDGAFYLNGFIKNCVVAEGVVEITDYSFMECTLESVKLPSTLERLGKAAFATCTGLEVIAIPESVIEIGEDAFCNCRGLKKVSMPERFKKHRKKIFGDEVNAEFDWI